MTHAFECSMGDKHVVQAVIFEGRLAGALEEMQLIYNMVYRRHTNPHIWNQEQKKKENKTKRKEEKRKDWIIESQTIKWIMVNVIAN